MHTEHEISFEHPIKKRMDGIEKFYGIEITYLPEEIEIRYIYSIAYITSIDEEYHCRIGRKQFFVNGVQPVRILDVLAERCMNAIYPIDFRVHPFNGITGVFNFKTLRERWKESVKDIKKEYSGTYADRYFEQINQSLSDENTFFKALKNEMLYTLHFFKMETLFVKEHIKRDVGYQLPIMPYRKLSEFYGNQRIHIKDTKMIFKYRGKNYEGNVVEIEHSIDKNDFTVHKVRGMYTAANNKKQIVFKITELKERERNIQNKESIEAIL